MTRKRCRARQRHYIQRYGDGADVSIYTWPHSSHMSNPTSETSTDASGVSSVKTPAIEPLTEREIVHMRNEEAARQAQWRLLLSRQDAAQKRAEAEIDKRNHQALQRSRNRRPLPR